ncbi:hypothetical protein B0H14DRAFT_2940569, partial [Mycena olivaceomarginata]
SFSFLHPRHSLYGAPIRRSLGFDADSAYCGAWILLIILIVIAIRNYFLRSPTTPPVSGFYGPGAWLAWLLTLGMTHGHALRAMTGELKNEWDYDLIGASGYTIAAAAANTSSLLPALLCAERVISVGTGSSLLQSRHCFSSGGFRAHEAIFKTTPVIWCYYHDGHEVWRGNISYHAVDIGRHISLHSEGTGWEWGRCSAAISGISFVETLVNRSELIVALKAAVIGAVAPAVAFVGYPYSAFSPWLGYFPLTGILREMDQISAFLGVLVIAALRTLHSILKMRSYEGTDG